MTRDDLLDMLGQLEGRAASSLEGQHLDFKQWIDRSRADSIGMIVRASVCMANGGGGSIVVGVNDKAVGQAAAVLGVPAGVDAERIALSVASKTAPRLSVVVEEVAVGFGTHRLLLVHVPACHTTTTDGQCWQRHGDECLPMTPDMIVSHLESRGSLDFTARTVQVSLPGVLSAVAAERLREISRREAPADLLAQSDEELLASLGVLRDGLPTIAALLLMGHEDALRRFVPAYKWTYLRMRSGTEYSDRADGMQALPIAVDRITDRIMVDNPIDTVTHGLLHFEYRKFPELAIREALLNAFGHADYTLASPITVEQYSDKLTISNPGSFVGGVRPSNILRHPSVSRNPCLMDALLKLRLVNRTHLGVRRMYEAMLLDGKEPPVWDDVSGAVRVVLLGQEMSPAFRAFTSAEDSAGRGLDLEDMIVLQHLSRHGEVTTSRAAQLTQQTPEEAKARLSRMALERGYLAKGGSGKGTYWRLRRDTHARLAGAGVPERDHRIDWETAKAQVVSALKKRAGRNEPGMSNADVRLITAYDRSQVKRLMGELRDDGAVALRGRGAGARYYHSCHRELSK